MRKWMRTDEAERRDSVHLRLETRWRSSPAGAGAHILAGLHCACAIRILGVRDDVVDDHGEGEDERQHVQDNDELVLDATAQRSRDPRLPLLSFESSDGASPRCFSWPSRKSTLPPSSPAVAAAVAVVVVPSPARRTSPPPIPAPPTPPAPAPSPASPRRPAGWSWCWCWTCS